MVAIQQLGLFHERDNVTVFRDVKRIEDKPRMRVGRFLMLGAGVQSSALAEMIIEGEIEGIDAAIFADTGDEPPWVYKQVWYLAGRFASIGIPLYIVRNGDLSLSKAAQSGHGRKASMPLFTKDEGGKVSMLRRQCTNEFKIVPGDDLVKNWLIERQHGKQITDKLGRTSRRISRKIEVEYLFGISLDEFQRMKSNGPKWQKPIYPLIDKRLNRDDCVKWLRKHRLPVPQKSACKQCPFHDDNYWLWLSINAPEVFEEVCQFDDWLRTPEGRAAMRLIHDEVYLHRSCIPLREVNFSKQTPMDNLLCGVHCMN